MTDVTHRGETPGRGAGEGLGIKRDVAKGRHDVEVGGWVEC